jgi:FKBP-type peptidyl-prolyl cis-trans isomerase
MVVARRSWLEIVLWETRKSRSKEKRAKKAKKRKQRKESKEKKAKKRKQRKERDGIQTAELDRRDQVTATSPGPVPFERGEQRSILR